MISQSVKQARLTDEGTCRSAWLMSLGDPVPLGPGVTLNGLLTCPPGALKILTEAAPGLAWQCLIATCSTARVGTG